MHTNRDTGNAGRPQRPTAPDARQPRAAPSPASEQPFGPDAATILASEHWSLLSFRSLIWNEAMSRATVFLSVLSAAIITLALLANAADGSHTTALALVLLPWCCSSASPPTSAWCRSTPRRSRSCWP